jgi:intracellular multiplication protein IcmC
MITLKRKMYNIIMMFVLSMFLVGCQGGQFPSLDQFIVNFSASFSGIWKLITAASTLLGLMCFFRGIHGLKVYGDMRTMMSTQANLKATLMLLLVGTVLLFYKPATQMFMMSTFGTDTISPISYSNSQLGFGVVTMNAILKFVQIIGFVSFIRGWMYFTQPNQGGQSHFGKALTHIIGGVLAINVQGTANVLQGTFGFV